MITRIISLWSSLHFIGSNAEDIPIYIWWWPITSSSLLSLALSILFGILRVSFILSLLLLFIFIMLLYIQEGRGSRVSQPQLRPSLVKSSRIRFVVLLLVLLLLLSLLLFLILFLFFFFIDSLFPIVSFHITYQTGPESGLSPKKWGPWLPPVRSPPWRWLPP